MSTTYDGGTPEIGSVAVAGDYVALVNERRFLHYGGSLHALAAFDLRTGTSIPSGVTRADCDLGGGPCPSGIDQVVVIDTDGANAAHTFVLDWPYSAIWPNCTFTEQIVTTDSTGTHILDSITTQTRCDRPPPAMQLS